MLAQSAERLVTNRVVGSGTLPNYFLVKCMTIISD